MNTLCVFDQLQHLNKPLVKIKRPNKLLKVFFFFFTSVDNIVFFIRTERKKLLKDLR